MFFSSNSGARRRYAAVVQVDIIADIHGEFEKLTQLLTKMGYACNRGVWGHPERKALFLGDYVDRGPQVRETLHLVRNMVDSRNAVALLGNHELNAIAFSTRGSDGQPLRAHSQKSFDQTRETTKAFQFHESEWLDFVDWFRGLPFSFEAEGFRAVHACWCDESIRFVSEKTLRDEDFLVKATTLGTLECHHLEVVLKGPEVRLPTGLKYRDSAGHWRSSSRVRWWNLEGGPFTYDDISMGHSGKICDQMVPNEVLRTIPNLKPGGLPVFFGHYSLPPNATKRPQWEGVCCLDFGVAYGGPLVAYRWSNKDDKVQPPLSAENFFWVD